MTQIIRRDPFADVMNMRRMFDRMFGPGLMTVGEDEEVETSLGLDVTEAPDHITVKAAVPGVRPEDIDISVEQGVLTIRGEMREERKSEQERPIRQEIRYGSFYRAVRLPASVDPDKAEAKLENGLLTIRFPKRPESQPKKLQIQATGGQQSIPTSQQQQQQQQQMAGQTQQSQ